MTKKQKYIATIINSTFSEKEKEERIRKTYKYIVDYFYIKRQ